MADNTKQFDLYVKDLGTDNHQEHVDAHLEFANLCWNIPSGGYPLPYKDSTEYDLEAVRDTLDQIQQDFAYILDKITLITKRIEITDWCHAKGEPTGCKAAKAGSLVLKVSHTDKCIKEHNEQYKDIE